MSDVVELPPVPITLMTVESKQVMVSTAVIELVKLVLETVKGFAGALKVVVA